MKRFVQFSAAFVASGLLASAAMAASSVNSTATANVVGPASIVENRALSFGTFGIGGANSRVSSGGTADAGITIITPGQHGNFTVSGSGSSYNLTGPTSITLSKAGAPSMTADIAVPFGTNTLTGGTHTFDVPGILNVNANQPAGTYTATYTLTVSY